MNKTKLWRRLGRLAAVGLGAIITAFSVQAFIVQGHLGSGGVGGIALLIYYVLGWPVGLMMLILNIPLFALGWRAVNHRFILKTMVGLVVFSLSLDLLKGVRPLPVDDIFLAALYGGVVGGLGGGIVFRAGGSLGGTDIVAKVIERKFGWSLGATSLAVNIMVISLSWVVLGSKIALYTLIAMFVSSWVLDAIVSGIPAKAVTIISDHAEELAHRILTELGRGATFLAGRGAYSDGKKNIIICVVSMPEVGHLKEIVREVDTRAFMIVQNASEVIGKGFVGTE